MQEQNKPVVPPVRAQRAHVWQLIIAAVMLAASMAALICMFSSLTKPPAGGDEQSFGYLFGSMVVLLANLITAIMGIVLCGFVWGVGMLLSARLAFKKQDKPRWLWICSVILTAIYTVLVLTVLIYLGAIAFQILSFRIRY